MSTPREIKTELQRDSRPLTAKERKRAAAVLRNLAEDVHLVNEDAAAEFLSSSDGRFLVNVWSRLRLQRTNRELVRRIHKVLGWLGAIVEFALQPPSRRPHFPDREQIVRACLDAADALAGPQAASAGDKSNDSSPKKAKRSTERGEGRAKLIAALTKHHKYADGSCLNLDPIGNNKLARLAGVSESTASALFDKEFNGHTKYRAICGNATALVASLKLLNQEYAPHHLYGSKPPDEGERPDGDEE